MQPYILGSSSPRRKTILSAFNLPFIQITSHFDELSIPFDGDGAKYAAAISYGKAKSLAKDHPSELILTADTVVIHEGKSYGKPENSTEAKKFLKELSGKSPSVFTAVTLYTGKEFLEGVCHTKVHFSKLTDREIDAYLKAVPFLDKAGGYTAELPGSILIDKIEGCYYNVLGLPIHTVIKLFKTIGIDLWEHLKV